MGSVTSGEVKAVAEAVERIISDITDRRGLGDAWEEIDEKTQREISRTWTGIVVSRLTAYKKRTL